MSLVVHDLKNLAGRLAALCQNLGERFDDPLFQRTVLEVLDDTVMHLQDLAMDLRDHEDRVLVKLRVDLNKVLEDALQDIRPDLFGRIRVVARLAAVPAIWGDAFLLREAFARAIENAVQAMPGRGTLTVRSAAARRQRTPGALVEIADDGPGMTREFLRECLVRPLASSKRDGLGLGIITMRHVALLHGGSVRILSAPGNGTRVRFHFPAEAGPAS